MGISDQTTVEGEMYEGGLAYLLRENLEGFKGSANLYRLDPPIVVEETERVNGKPEQVLRVAEFAVVSRVNAPSGPETYIFQADKDGNVPSWLELEGSAQGTYTHEEVLANAGYVVINKTKEK